MPDDDTRPSAPMSPLPSRPDGRQPTGSHRAVAMSDPEWEVPHKDDDRLPAVAWRARRGMRIAEEARASQQKESVETRASLAALNANVAGLNTRIDAWGARWDEWKASARAVALWALKIVGGLALTGVVFALWYHLSTLHH